MNLKFSYDLTAIIAPAIKKEKIGFAGAVVRLIEMEIEIAVQNLLRALDRIQEMKRDSFPPPVLVLIHGGRQDLPQGNIGPINEVVGKIIDEHE